MMHGRQRYLGSKMKYTITEQDLVAACERSDRGEPEPMLKSITKHLPDINMSFLAVPSEATVKFTIYEIDSYISNGMIPLFHRKNSTCYPDPIDDMRKADVYMEGCVKFDGCSNWNFPELKHAWLHCCSREELNKVSAVMQACWDTAKELLGESFYGR